MENIIKYGNILKLIDSYTLIQFSFLKRALPSCSLKEIKSILKDLEKDELIKRISIPGIVVYKLSCLGCKLLNKEEKDFTFSKEKIVKILSINHLRLGIRQSSINKKIEISSLYSYRELKDSKVELLMNVLKKLDQNSFCESSILVSHYNNFSESKRFIKSIKYSKNRVKNLLNLFHPDSNNSLDVKDIENFQSKVQIIFLVKNNKEFWDDYSKINQLKEFDNSFFLARDLCSKENPLHQKYLYYNGKNKTTL